MFSLILTVELCRPGWSGGLVPEIRIGVARLAWCRGSLLRQFRSYEATLRDAQAQIRRLLTKSPASPSP